MLVERVPKRQCGGGGGKRVRIASPAAEDIIQRRSSLIEQGVVVEAFNTELSDIFAVEVKPARSARYLRWFDKKSMERDRIGPTKEELSKAHMPLHRKIFFLMEQQLPGRDLPTAPIELLGSTFGRSKLEALEEDSVVAWVASQDPTSMIHRICAAAIIGCNGRSEAGPVRFIIRLFTTAKEVTFGRRKVKIRGYGWGKLLLQEIERHLVAPRNCPYLLVESVADAWRYWAKMGFELKSSRGSPTAASSSSSPDDENADNITAQIGRYNQTLIGSKRATSARGKAGKGKGKGADAYGKGKKGKGSKGGEEPKGVTSRKDDTGPAGSSSKVVIRLLPPSITEDQLWQSIPEGVKGSIVWRYFVAGSQPKRPTISVPAVNSRCYLEFETKQQAFDFVNSFHGHKFVDQEFTYKFG
ncbi:hypothetical protein Pmar_PMAR010017 [Perkinsus marinus ATCC 50983]|uniref:UPF3 domain-containing protein n=1 Tax=Perkinsus marinus (strain ATCC 50983 / TXsc) TaxID=423536 RepID=C5K5J4_PERM5|nr:hypothetical protein Pmar_PMAR010017 [Perkinsus marinus ATCC 50983]EER20256.1 hypothetical protein Pmar_PMAR010017 [Perkinsus marinus ATCC 50983]|eukprot:XP_002788460.1 hypothetical protein Pmar_PMAR010017 [Perkinsus marinus ATCC 50983]